VAQTSHTSPSSQGSQGSPQLGAQTPVSKMQTQSCGQSLLSSQPTAPLDDELEPLEEVPLEEVLVELLVVVEPPVPPSSTVVLPPQAQRLDRINAPRTTVCRATTHPYLMMDRSARCWGSSASRQTSGRR